MKTIVLALAAITVAFAQTPAAKAPEKTAAAPASAVTATAKPEAKPEAMKVAKKHVKKAVAGKPTAAIAAPTAK